LALSRTPTSREWAFRRGGRLALVTKRLHCASIECGVKLEPALKGDSTTTPRSEPQSTTLPYLGSFIPDAEKRGARERQRLETMQASAGYEVQYWNLEI